MSLAGFLALTAEALPHFHPRHFPADTKIVLPGISLRQYHFSFKIISLTFMGSHYRIRTPKFYISLI